MAGGREEGSRTPAAPTRAPGAAFHDENDWNQIDWKRVEQDVRRLQVRIAKATKEGRWGKVQPCNVCSPTRSAARRLPCDG
jgi:N-terminal domain of reverse transcriptase